MAAQESTLRHRISELWKRHGIHQSLRNQTGIQHVPRDGDLCERWWEVSELGEEVHLRSHEHHFCVQPLQRVRYHVRTMQHEVRSLTERCGVSDSRCRPGAASVSE
jgi:hypothetical protein